jgi:hypothetical protein
MRLISLELLGLALATAAPAALSPSGAAEQAKTPAPQLREGASVLGNGDFSVWDGYRGTGVTVTSVGVPIGSIPKHWYGGPGVGGTATYDVVPFPPGQTDVPGNPKWHLRIAWSRPPAKEWQGEEHHNYFRCTVLENFSMTDVRRTAGKTLLVRFYARVQRGTLDLIPILWHSYDSQTPGIAAVKGKGYELFESSGRFGQVAVAHGRPRAEAVCRLTDRWQKFEKLIALPPVGNRYLSPDNYTGFGFDVTDRALSILDIAAAEVRPVDPRRGSRED